MKRWVLLICALLIAAELSYLVKTHFFSPSDIDHAIELDWRVLSEMDYISGNIGKELRKMDGKMVRLPGFMVPLEDNSKKIVEFLLVPAPQMCIHVPPPPPNQTVHVTMKDRGVEAAWYPIWVYGILRIAKKKSNVTGGGFGDIDSEFEIEGLHVEQYREK